jgi:hypothetical protein
MNGPDILALARDQLTAAIAQQGTPPLPTSLPISPWVAMSLLQKAIRRGEEHLALQAATTLLRDAPDRLWRRLGCIAFEDISHGNLDTVFLVTAALAGKTIRAKLGGEWPVVAFIISRMVQAPKCRASDDLLIAVEAHPFLEQARSDLVHQTTPNLLRIATGSEPLPVRALALWYALGTDRRPSKHLLARRGEPRAVFDHLCEAGFPHTVVEIAREGFRKTGEMLCPFVALMAPMKLREPRTVMDDELPPEVMIAGVPGWAYDLYSREGRAGLARFLEGSSNTSRWVRTRIPPSQRVGFLGNLVFRVEGGLVRNRLRWGTGDELRRLVDVEGQGTRCPDATEVLQIMRADLALLQEARHVAKFE